MGTSVDAPPPRNIAQETGDTLATQIALAPSQYNAYAQFAPQYAQTDINTLGSSIFGPQDSNWTISDINKRLTDQASLQSQQANTAQRTADVADVSRLGGQVNDIRQSLNPQLFSAQNAFQQAAFSPVQQSAQQQQFGDMASRGFGTFDPSGLFANTSYTGGQINAPSSMLSVSPGNVRAPSGNPVLNTLSSRAQNTGITPNLAALQGIGSDALSQGGQLSPDELRNVQQSSRAGFAARGLDATNASVVDEALQTQAAQRNRLLQNVGLAQGIESQVQGATQAQNQFGLGVGNELFGYGSLGLNAAQGNQSANLQGQLANQGAYADLGRLGLSAQQSNQAAGLQSQGLSLEAQRANQAFGLGSFQANQQSQMAQADALRQAALLQEQQRQAQLQAQQAAIGNQQATFFDPFQGVLGRSSGNVGTNAGLFGMGNSQTSGANANTASMFNPFNPYSSDLYNTNYNADAAARISSANNSSAMIGSGIGAAGSIIGAKLMFMCVPEGEKIDTPSGRKNIENVRAGDTILGYNGDPVKVLQKHEYAESPTEIRFVKLSLDNGKTISVCDMHRVGGTRAKDFEIGCCVGDSTIIEVSWFSGVERSYDLLTEDGGYRIAGVPVNSMISEMMEAANAL